MKYILKEMGKDELPREKIKKFGLNSLSDTELLAVILKSGIKDKSVLDLSREILDYYSHLKRLEDASYEELLQIKGIGEAKALELVASIELGKRMSKVTDDNIYIRTAKDAYIYIKYYLKGLSKEHFMCIYLNNHNKVVAHKLICIGSENETTIDVKEALRWSLRLKASYIIFIHNHPSGDPKPSNNDFLSTDLFKRDCKLLDVIFVDHLIVGDNCYYSFVHNKTFKD